MKLAIWQMNGSDDLAGNLEGVCARIREAAESGADLVVFPEYVMFWEKRAGAPLIAAAESLDGPFLTAVRVAAAASRVAVVVNLFEANHETGKPFNTLAAIDEGGDIVGVYRKAHLYNAFGYREDDAFTAGPWAEPTVLDLAGIRIGLQICYDLRFPEGARAAVDAGAELLLYPAAWVPGPKKEEHWATLLAARAIENTAYVAGIGLVFPAGSGGSRVIDPMGAILGDLAEQQGMLLVDILPERVTAVRERNPSLENRRFGVVELDELAATSQADELT